jgi:MarR-like DNA-binding transcriptional regulator SgrR of sgrS sRNA
MATAKKPAPKKKAAAGKARADWDAIERDYRTGKFTLRELAAKYDVSHQAIAKRSKTKGWTQDLSVAIKQATNAKLVAELVNHEVAKGGQEVANTVLAAADLNKQVILRHRTDILEARSVAFDLLAELRASAMLVEHQDLLAEILAGEDPTTKQDFKARQTVARALELGNRVGCVKALSEALTKLQAAERKAFALDDDEPPEGDADARALTDAERAVRMAALLAAAK